ncbi:MAG: electron transfer flavoprotein subunit alpha/FixB family protein [Clostridia bacterium]|nr:electron transfer flavoprotein subunit alpha/FixB family protein [Clostridiales bacterium]MBQ4049617.1 electron transfer flavoprotein subunit alpha/FixB family protein [Clostridia bacterium]
MNKNIWVFCEQRDGEIQPVALELLGIAKELSEKTNEKVGAILVGHNVKAKANDLVAYGADEVYVVDDEELDNFLTEPYVQAVYKLVSDYKPSILLFGATSIGRDLAPRLSARLRTGLTADCTKLECDEKGNLFMTRPAFGGNLFATIACPDHRPQMSTVRPGVMKKAERDDSRKGEIIDVKIDWDTSKFAVKLIEEVKEVQSVDKIEDAKILVSCGRGVKNVKPAFEVAEKLKGTVSSSRALVDAGVMEHARQVGQTGKTVRPQAYLAFGISGAIQHLAGMEESEFIVAVNTDKSAPIFKVANLGIVSDAAAVMKNLIKML